LKTALLVPAALAALALAGCGAPAASPGASASASASGAASAEPSSSASATPSAAPTAHPSLAASTSIDAITVTDVKQTATATPEPSASPSATPSVTSWTEPKITFKAPFAIDQTRSKVIKAGTGPAVTDTSWVNVNYHGVNAYTDKVFDSSYERQAPVQFNLAGVVPGFKTGLTGKHVGDRVLIAIPGKDGYDSSGGTPDGSVLVGDTMLFVVDIIDVDYQAPYGTAVAPKAGLPTVTTDAKGVPSVTIDTAATPPASTVVQPLVAGQGTLKVAAGDTVITKYRMYSWKTGKLLLDAYDTGDRSSLGNTLTCLSQGLTGQPIGSRLLIVCPPATGFPNGAPTPSVAAGDTVVFVLDLMFATPQ